MNYSQKHYLTFFILITFLLFYCTSVRFTLDTDSGFLDFNDIHIKIINNLDQNVFYFQISFNNKTIGICVTDITRDVVWCVSIVLIIALGLIVLWAMNIISAVLVLIVTLVSIIIRGICNKHFGNVVVDDDPDEIHVTMVDELYCYFCNIFCRIF